MHKKVVAVILALFVAISGVMYPYRAKAYAGALFGLALGGLLVACGLTFMTTEDLNRAVASVQNWFTPDDIFTLETALEGGSYDENGNYNFDAPLTTFTKVQAYAATFVDAGDGTGVIHPTIEILPGSATAAGIYTYQANLQPDGVYNLGTMDGISYSIVTTPADKDGKIGLKFVTYMNGHTISYLRKDYGYIAPGNFEIQLTPVFTSSGTQKGLNSSAVLYQNGSSAGLITGFTSVKNSLIEAYEFDGLSYASLLPLCEAFGVNYSKYTDSPMSGGWFYAHSFIYDMFYKPYLTPVDVLIDYDYLLGEKSALGKDVIGLVSDYVLNNIDARDYINGNTVTGDLADVLNPADSISVSIPQTMDKVQEATADDILTDTSTVPVNPPSDLPLPEIPRNIFTDKFPFCLPFDLYNAFVGLVATPTPPKFVMPMEIGGWLDEDITIDFEPFTPLALICKWGLSVVFVIALIKISRKMIGAQ